jgi:hypothetical protein
MLSERQLAPEAEAQSDEYKQDLSQKRSAPQESSADLSLSIKDLQAEFQQISELTELERNYALEILGLLKGLIEPLNVSLHVKPSAVSKSDNTIKDVVLTPQGTICIVRDNGAINARPFDSLPSEALMRILTEVIPEVRRLLVERRQKINGRVGMLEKVVREFRKFAATAEPAKPKIPSSSKSRSSQFSKDKGAEDAIKSILGDPQKNSSQDNGSESGGISQ